MIFRSWPIAREYAGTACLAAVLDAEYASRAAQAQPLLNTPGKRGSRHALGLRGVRVQLDLVEDGRAAGPG